MNEQIISQRMAGIARLTPAQAKSALQAFQQAVLVEIKQGRSVAFQGFGRFEVITRDNGQQALIFRQANSIKEVLNHGSH